MLARLGKALGHFLRAGQANGNAAPVVAVVRLGDYWKPESARGGLRAFHALHQFLARHRQAERAQDLVGFFLVAGQFHGNVRGLAGHRSLDALLEAAMPELHQ